jgi:hypothetical protein
MENRRKGERIAKRREERKNVLSRGMMKHALFRSIHPQEKRDTSNVKM